MDDREGFTPGHKFNYWELRGVPVRIEIGPKDVANQSVALARRDVLGREGKSIVPQESVASAVNDLLIDIQHSLLERATHFRDSNTSEPRDYVHFKEIVANGFAFAWWCGGETCETAIKNETKATSRCIPDSGLEDEDGKCIYCGEMSTDKVYFARSY